MKTCEKCGELHDSLEAHHVIPKSLGGSDGIENIKMLCNSCHKKAHGLLPKNVNHSELVKAGVRRSKGIHYTEEEKEKIWKAFERKIYREDDVAVSYFWIAMLDNGKITTDNAKEYIDTGRMKIRNLTINF